MVVLMLFALNMQVLPVLEVRLPDYSAWCTTVSGEPGQFAPGEQEKLGAKATMSLARVATEAGLARIGVPYVESISATTDEQGKLIAKVRYCAVVPTDAPVPSGEGVVPIKIAGAKATAAVCDVERVTDCQMAIVKRLNTDPAKTEEEVIASAVWRLAGTTAKSVDESAVVSALTAATGFVLPPPKAPTTALVLPPVPTRVVVAAVALSQ